MKSFRRMRSWFQLQGGQGQRRPATRAERGQALVVIAMAMVGLLAFIGLTVDSGILFIGEGHLRRAVDAAALAAATQFRVGSDPNRLQIMAAEVVHLNGVDPTTLSLFICQAGDPHNDDSLCPKNGAPHRKLVKVVATTQVRFAFLSIVGIPSTTIVANATSETASVDVVLVIDTSNSMTFDVKKWSDTFSVGPNEVSSYWFPNGPITATVPDGCNQDPLARNPDPSYTGYCLPFNQVKHAAVDFIHHLYWPYDRLAIVTFDQAATVVQPLTNTLTVADWENTIKGLTVSPPHDPPYPGCTILTDGNPSGCTNTSTGGGLKLAGGQFGLAPVRQESVWVVILLTDGAANASEAIPNSSVSNRFCPPSTWLTAPPQYDPFCRDADKFHRHTLLNPAVWATYPDPPPVGKTYNYTTTTYDVANYDADDYARDNADFVACSAKIATAARFCRDTLDYLPPASPGARGNEGGQGALIYSIGLGNLVINNPYGGGVINGSGIKVRIDPNDPKAGYDAGDALLRYIANVGLDGNPDPSFGPDPCQGVPPPQLDAQPDPYAPKLHSNGNLSYNCGNYYFSQTGTGLNAVFQSIASRIFTRITQ